jgi:K+-sensing histidine kinase KdpD
VAVAFTLSLAVAAARAEDPHRLTRTVCLGLLAAAAAFSAAGARRTTAAAVALTAWLFDNGFVANHAGELHWHTAADLRTLTLLAGCALASAVLTSRLRRSMRDRPQLPVA